MSDIDLSNKAFKAMQGHEYDIAINNVRRMENKAISVKMELLIIEHEEQYRLEQKGREIETFMAVKYPEVI